MIFFCLGKYYFKFFIMKVEDYFEKKKQKTDKSFAFLIERCPRSEENPYNIKLCKPDLNRATVVLLGGTVDERNALRLSNGFLKKIDDFVFNICSFEKKDAQVCTAVCSFGKYLNPDMARRLLYLYHKDHRAYEDQMQNFDKLEVLEYAVPNYVADLFEQLIMPRLCDEKQNLLPFDIALQRVSKLVVIAYCHGAYTWMKLEEQINLLLTGINYTNRQKKRLLKSIIVVAYSPDCPLGYSKAQFISFSSASDLSIQHGNGFIRYVHRNMFVEDFGLSYLSGKLGRAFYCAKYSKEGVEGNPCVFRRVDPKVWYENRHQQNAEVKEARIYEHGFLGFFPYPNMSYAAFKMQKMAIFVLIGAIENSISKKPQKLSVFSLVGGLMYNFWSFQIARVKGFVIMLKYRWWARKPHRYSFADNVNFVSID